MDWRISWRADPRAKRLADAHYNRQNPDADQFVPPGRCVVLLTLAGDALWVTSWPLAEYAHHEWAGAWVCTTFRNEGPVLSSELITQAVAATRYVFGEPPPGGMVTFVDPAAVRHKRDPGRCYRRAGFKPLGWTVTRNRLCLGLAVADMPEADQPLGYTADLLEGIA
jgi:hypothetical protein